MNKVYKLVWSNSLHIWVVCSELGKKSKSKSGGITVLVSALGLLATPTVFAAQCASLNSWAGGNCEIYENTNYTANIGWHNAVDASGGAQKTIVKSSIDNTLGDFIINSNTSSSYTDYASGGFGANNAKLTANKLSVTLRPETGKTVRMFGARVLNGGEITTNDLDVDLIFARERTDVRGPIESYAVQVGTAITGDDRLAGKTSKITVNNANLKITNTAATQDTWFLPGLGAYNLSGIRVIRNEDNLGSNAIFESTGKVTINAFDSSTSNTGTYITGIYVSGENNKAILNDSEITLGKSGQYSSALKIGKGRSTGTGGGLIESHGKMVLDTTAESTAPTVRLIGTGSKLNADYDNSSSEIKSANTAVLFGTYDYTSRYKSTDQEANFKDAKINTTSTNDSLILVNAGVTGAKMNVKGSESILTAAESGWLVEVEDPSKWASNQAALSFTLDDNAKAQGVMTTSGASTLDVNVNNGAIWELKSKADLTEQRSTLTSFNLTNDAVLDAATNLTSSDAAEYFLKVPLFNNNSGKKLSKNIVKKEIKVKENFVNRIDKNKLFRILIGASIILPFVPIFMINGNDIEDIFNNYIYAYIFFFIAFSILMFPFFYVPNLFARTGIMKINDDNLFFKFGRKEVKIPFINLRYKQDIIEQTSIGYNIIIRTIDDKEISFSVYSEQSKNDVKEALKNIYWNNEIVNNVKDSEQDLINWLDENK